MARRGTRRKPAGQTGDKGMVDSLFCHSALRIRDVIRQLAGEVVHPLNNPVRIEPDVVSHFAPVTRLNIAKAIFTTKLHGKLRFPDVDLRVGQDARHVVKRRKADPAQGSNKKSIVLRMCVGTDDQPVECNRIDKSVDVLTGFTGVGPEQLNNFVYAGTTFVLVFARRHYGERLTDILLMDAPYSCFGTEPVIALDNDGDLVPEMHDPGINDGEAQGARQFQGEVLIFGVAVEGGGGWLENVGSGNPARKEPPISHPGIRARSSAARRRD